MLDICLDKMLQLEILTEIFCFFCDGQETTVDYPHQHILDGLVGPVFSEAIINESMVSQLLIS